MDIGIVILLLLWVGLPVVAGLVGVVLVARGPSSQRVLGFGMTAVALVQGALIWDWANSSCIESYISCGGTEAGILVCALLCLISLVYVLIRWRSKRLFVALGAIVAVGGIVALVDALDQREPGPSYGLPASMAPVNGLKACPEKGPAGFTHYWLGEEFEGVPVESVERLCDGSSRDNTGDFRENKVTYEYSCESCRFIRVENSPSCEDSLAKMRDLSGRFRLEPRLDVRGAPAYFNGELRIYAGDATILLAGAGREDSLRAAEALRTGPPGLSLVMNDLENGGIDDLKDALDERGVDRGATIGPGEQLPPPIPGAIKGKPEC